MSSICILFSLQLSVLIQSCDIPPEATSGDHKTMQYNMMLQCITPKGTKPEYRRRMLRYLSSGDRGHEDPCTWLGVKCTNDEITTLIFPRGVPSMDNTYEWRFDPDWLPCSLHFVHLEGLVLTEGWAPERLPRDIRYFHTNCYIAPGMDTHREINIRSLPRKMEELYSFYGWSSGTLLVADLPKTMRLCFINCRYIRKAFVENVNLPNELSLLVINGKDMKCKMVSLDDEPVDSRMSCQNNPSENYSALCFSFQRESRRMVDAKMLHRSSLVRI